MVDKSYLFALLIFFQLFCQQSFAQFDFPPLSAKAHIIQQVGHTQVEIDYERPSARNRKIFGGLVPWNQVWRTGAGPCTKITFSDEVQIGKQRVPAGTYSLFSIPTPDSWTIILNKDTSLYGSYKYDLQKDVARFKVPVKQSSRYYESLTIDIDVVPNNAQIYISWEHVSLNFGLKTSSDDKVMAYIREELMTDKVKDPGEYAMAAGYYVYQGENLFDALALTNKALVLGGNGFPLRLKMEILEKLMRYPEAIEAGKAGAEFSQNRPMEEKWRAEEVEGWMKSVRRIEAKLEKQNKN